MLRYLYIIIYTHVETFFLVYILKFLFLFFKKLLKKKKIGGQFVFLIVRKMLMVNIRVFNSSDLFYL